MQDLPLTTDTLRLRAKQCRRLASSFDDGGIRERLLAIASDYEALVRRADELPAKTRPVDLAERIARRARAS
jgi:hypothetical protein